MADGAAVIGPMPLVGRLGVLDRIVGTFANDDHAAFVLAGSAGVGKTRLASEIARAANEMGHATAHVVATRSASAVPFGAFAPLLPGLPDPSAGGGAAAPGTGLLGLLRHAAEAIAERRIGNRPLLLVVDDAHLLDDGSAALVHQLVHEASCNLVASVRTPGPAPDPITTLWKDGLADRLDLNALSEPEVEELVTSTLGGPVTGPGLRWLWTVSGGNPLYVRELLTGAASSGALGLDGGLWVLRLPLPAPARLAELLESKLAGLPAATGEVVDLLAVGEPLSLDVLETMVPPEAVEDAEARGLIVVRDRGGRPEIGLGHPLYGEVQREQMPRVRRRRLCAALARALSQSLEGDDPRPEDELRVARFQLEAGVRGDAGLLARAGASARYLCDLDLASRLARAALDAGAGVEAGIALAEAELFSGRPDQAAEILADLAPKCRSDIEVGNVAYARAYNLGVLLGDLSGAQAVLAAALGSVTETAARRRLISGRATIDLYRGSPRTALTDANELLESGEETFMARGAYVASIALAALGRSDEAISVAYRGRDAHVHSGDISRRPESQLIGAVLGLAGAGRLHDAEDEARQAYEANLGANDPEGIATWGLMLGLVLAERGMSAAAERKFREAASHNRKVRDVSALRWCLGGVALTAAAIHDVDTATAAVAELDKTEHWMVLFNPDLVERGRAWTMAAVGELTATRAFLVEVAQKAGADGLVVAEARLLHDLVVMGDASQAVATRLHELTEVVDGELVTAFANSAAATRRTSGPDLQASAEHFERLGALGLASHAYRTAADAFRTEGLQRRVTACGLRATELDEQRGALRLGGTGVRQRPTRVGPGPARLTRREREVAGLAAAGASSRDIADKLFLSARTVDNHLLRVYAKLGITSREELAAAL